MKDWIMYYEVSTYFDSGESSKYGGFLYVNDYTDGAHQIEELFGDDLYSIEKMEILESCILPVKASRAIYEIVKESV